MIVIHLAIIIITIYHPLPPHHRHDWKGVTLPNRNRIENVARQEFLNKSGVAGIFGPGTRIPAAADEVIDAIERALIAQEN